MPVKGTCEKPGLGYLSFDLYSKVVTSLGRVPKTQIQQWQRGLDKILLHHPSQTTSQHSNEVRTKYALSNHIL